MHDSVPSVRYSSIYNVLRLWIIWLIPTYRVYRLYDISPDWWKRMSDVHTQLFRRQIHAYRLLCACIHYNLAAPEKQRYIIVYIIRVKAGI